ncbi:hypothetical protein P153DRAFT_111967 [Dothidotthia symphoricarpi CBS 119687]|uniref:Uncharacterized protein n=1 Tax=Dothidotthia symphoricarpi CBS 119687 TaxID=1392245 RepID=A0A6A6A038_9PLEO|nr:uncharacterized protein P153DRAFT_111967 [Dothidotthia symphoricarpi CBS 119687]KAF2125372.1 hypothetical protein P153DRAFT_111967 [Dothidotthia symphoricarpi CBS 119687]
MYRKGGRREKEGDQLRRATKKGFLVDRAPGPGGMPYTMSDQVPGIGYIDHHLPKGSPTCLSGLTGTSLEKDTPLKDVENARLLLVFRRYYAGHASVVLWSLVRSWELLLPEVDCGPENSRVSVYRHPRRSCSGHVFSITGQSKSFHDPRVYDTIQGSRPNQTSTNGCLGSRTRVRTVH